MIKKLIKSFILYVAPAWLVSICPDKWQEKFLRADSFFIACIKNPSEYIQLLAMELNPKSIRRIKNPTEQVQMLAIENSWHNHVDIFDPTPSVLEYLIEKCADKFSASSLILHYGDILSDEQKVYLSLLS